MTKTSDIDAFVEWAKALLDEMGAATKALEERLDTLDAEFRQEAVETIAKVRTWVIEGEAKLQKVREEGESALAEAKDYIEKAWSDFEPQVDKWVEIANNQQATFEAQAKAQLQSWQGMTDKLLKKAAEVHESGKADAQAEIERLKREAKNAEAQLDEFRKAGAKSWGAMNKALNKSRSAFEKAAKQAWSEFSKTAKG
jgi:hypothetical protein